MTSVRWDQLPLRRSSQRFSRLRMKLDCGFLAAAGLALAPPREELDSPASLAPEERVEAQ